MRVAYFGTYERTYPRNAQVISCLRRAGVDVVEVHQPVWEGAEEKWRAGVGALPRLLMAQLRLLRAREAGVGAVIVGYPGHLDLPAARRFARGRPIVFNPLVSLVDTFVSDRGRFRSGSPAARLLTAVDRRALRSAELVVADTEANAAFLASLGDIPRDRVGVCLVGAEERVFHPPRVPADPPTALFVGKLIPLHGLDTILEAARRAPGVRLRVIGSGQLQPLLDDRPHNVEWVPWLEYERLGDELRRATCALGIFGRSGKAARVIPNKAFQALACGVPLITADTPAARELLTADGDAILVPPGDAAALAEALLRITADRALAQRIGNAGLETYRRSASEDVLGVRWRSLIESVL